MRMIVRDCTPRVGFRRGRWAVGSGISSLTSRPFVAALFSAAVCTLQPAQAQYVQQGPKLVGSGPVGGAEQGSAAALSADGNTAIVGGRFDNSNSGALWVFTRSGGVWTQQGPKLVGTGAGAAAPSQGFAVAISADGNTAITSGYTDNMGVGAAWVFIRDSGVWVQQGPKLVGTGAASAGFQGTGVALSADGNTAIVGSQNDGTSGATWVFTRSTGTWTQQGAETDRHRGNRKCRAGHLRRRLRRRQHVAHRRQFRQLEHGSGVGIHPQWQHLDSARHEAGRHRGHGSCPTSGRGRALRRWQYGDPRRTSGQLRRWSGVGFHAQRQHMESAGPKAGRHRGGRHRPTLAPRSPSPATATPSSWVALATTQM